MDTNDSIERNIAVSLIRYYRRLIIDYKKFEDNPSFQIMRVQAQNLAKQLVEGERLNLTHLIREDAKGFLESFDESKVSPDMTKEERKGLDEYKDRFRLLRDATDEQYLRAFEISKPHIENLLTKHGVKF